MVVDIKPDHSPIGLLGKFFFRRQAPWVQRRKMVLVMWSIIVGLVCGGIVVTLTIVQNVRK